MSQFVVAFTPTSTGLKTATVHISNSDCTGQHFATDANARLVGLVHHLAGGRFVPKHRHTIRPQPLAVHTLAFG